MKVSSAIIGSLMLAISLSGCTSRFFDDFEHDTDGSLPKQPSQKSASSALYTATANSRIRAHDALNGKLSLELRGPFDQKFPPSMYFWGGDMNGKKDVKITWTGKRIGAGMAEVAIQGSQNQQILKLFIMPGRIVVSDPIFPSVEFNDLSDAVKHVFSVTVSPQTGKYRVNLDGATAPLFVGIGHAIGTTKTITAKFSIIGAAVANSSESGYRMDDVDIAELGA